MTTKHVVVWLDHAQAHVIHFTPEAAENEVIKTHSTHAQVRTDSGSVGGGHTAESVPYLHDIANALEGSLEILIVGPGNEKLALLKHIQKHHHVLAENVVSVETVDHPTDGQLLAYARKYFVKADRML